MANIFHRGFDNDNYTSLTRKFAITGTTTNITIGSGTGRRGGNCLRFSSANTLEWVYPAALTTSIIGFALYPETLGSGGVTILQQMESGSAQVLLVLNSDGTITIRRNSFGSTALITTSYAMISGNWYYIEWETYFHGTSGYSRLYFNGATTASVDFSGDTTQTANNYATSMRFGGSGSTFLRVDDLYVNDISGTRNKTILGDMKVTSRLPSGVGQYSGLSPSSGVTNYLMVDESSPDDDSTTVSGTAGTDTYTFPSLGYTPESIAAVSVSAVAKKDDTDTRNLAGVMYRSGVSYATATQTVSTNYLLYDFIFQDDPATSAEFSVSNLEASEFGIRVS